MLIKSNPLFLQTPTSLWSTDNTLLLLMGLLGGVGLFLFGMQLLSQSMKNLAGRQMRHFLTGISKNRIYGAGFGVFFTILFQSSSAATVVLVSFVDAGLITFAKTLPVVLGTAFGTTITAQLVAFKIGKYALFGIGLGYLLSISSKGRWKYFFEVLLSLGLLFYGMEMMGQSVKPLQSFQPFLNILSHISHPVIALLIGFVATAIIQSSAAFIGILIALGATSMLDLEYCLPMILGSNIGTTVTGLISSINLGREAKRVAFVNFTFKTITAFLFIIFLSKWESLTIYISGSTPSFGRTLANAHTLFNLILLIVWLPFTNWFGKWFEKSTFKESEKNKFSLKYLTPEVLDSPTLSVTLLKKEVLSMGQVVLKMVENSIGLFTNKNQTLIEDIRQREKDTDAFRQHINDFWLKSATVTSREKWPAEVYQLLHLVNELEQIADLISVNLIHQAENYIQLEQNFSPEGLDELVFYHNQCMKQLNRALELVENRDYHRALKMKEKYREYAYMAFDLEMSHYKRLFSPQSQSVETSKIHIELLNILRIINSRATNFGRLVLRESKYTDL